jgi:hypothetical protein
MTKKFIELKVSLFIFSFLVINSVSAQWTSVGPKNGPGFTVNDLQTFGADLYAGGASSNGKSGIAQWDGTNWTSIARVYPIYKQFALGITSLTVYGNQICAAGLTDSIGGIKTGTSDVVTYNGSSWSKLGSNPPEIDQVNILKVFNNELYVGGNGLNKWDGTNWTSVSSKANTTGGITALEVYNNELYAAGNFTKIGGISLTDGQGIAKWNGTAWVTIPAFVDSMAILPGWPKVNAASVASLITFKSELYAVGSIASAGTQKVRAAARWNGTSWNDVGGGFSGTGTLNANCLASDANNLYIVGSIQKVGTNNDSVALAASWDGTAWHSMLGSTSLYSFFSVENYNDEIYSAYQGMVKWTGNSTTISKPASIDANIQIYPNPTYDKFTISTTASIKQIEIYDNLGKLILTGNRKENDISHFESGIYFLKIQMQDKTVVYKNIIKN